MDESTERAGPPARRAAHPADPAGAGAEPVVTRRGRGLGANRHLGQRAASPSSAMLGAYGAVDYGFYRTLGTDLTVYQGGEISDQAMIAFAIAAGCLFVAAAAGRISGPRAAAGGPRPGRRSVRVDRARQRVLRRPGQRHPRDVEPHQLRPGRRRRGALPDGGGRDARCRCGRSLASPRTQRLTMARDLPVRGLPPTCENG